MNQTTGILIFVALAIVALALMAWGWIRRTRRDAGIAAPVGVARGEERARFAGFYVATTAHEKPLERLAVRHLAFRSRVAIAVTTEGVALDLPGEPALFLPADAVLDALRATWTIDRVVETDGLVALIWRSADGTVCDTYIRLQEGDPGALVAAVLSLHPDAASDSTSTGASS